MNAARQGAEKRKRRAKKDEERGYRKIWALNSAKTHGLPEEGLIKEGER